MTDTPDIAAPGKAISRSARKRIQKDKRICPVCATNVLEEGEDRCANCTEKAVMSREGLHVGRDWLILIVGFTALVLAGKWLSHLF